jgi:hypothetical protein
LKFILAFTSLALIIISIDVATAAPKRDFASCQKLAADRGFVDQKLGGQARDRRIFIRNCMNGTQS